MIQNYDQKLIFGEDYKACIKRRALANLMLKENISTVTIARIIGITVRQAENYKKELTGENNIYKDRHYRPVSDMAAFEKEIITNLTEHPVSTVKQAVKRIEKLTGIKRSTTQVRNFMKKHGLKPLKTAAVPAKMNPENQRAFLTNELEPRLTQACVSVNFKDKAENSVETGQTASTESVPIDNSGFTKNQNNAAQDEIDEKSDETMDAWAECSFKKACEEKKETVILFMDAAHFVWSAFLGILWCTKRIFIPAPSGRNRINVLGAYDPVANKLLKIINRTYINSEVICEMLMLIFREYKGKFITIVLDNARYQHCNLVTSKAKMLGIELLFLPTYSPNLNLIERLWRFVKTKCLRNEFYETSKEFEEAILKCLDSVNTENALEIKKLMSMKFQMFDKCSMLNTYKGKDKKFKVAA